MEGKSLKDVYNRLIDLYGFYEINKDSDEYKIALRFMSQEDLLKDDIDNIRLLVKDDGEDYMYFIINENTDYIGGGACGEEMKEQVSYFKSEDKLIEAQRIAERTNFDVEMMKETGFCSGIENYSRHLTGFLQILVKKGRFSERNAWS